MEQINNIKGWGADLEPSKRPAYPKERTPPRNVNIAWTTPEQQPIHTKIFKSNERPTMTRVFGTSVPPRGLSGILRGASFRWSENDIRHWLVQLFADRIDVVEGLIDDLRRGYVPNIFAEMGWNAEWKYNRKGAIKKIAFASTVLGLATIYFATRSSKSQPKVNWADWPEMG